MDINESIAGAGSNIHRQELAKASGDKPSQVTKSVPNMGRHNFGENQERKTVLNADKHNIGQTPKSVEQSSVKTASSAKEDGKETTETPEIKQPSTGEPVEGEEIKPKTDEPLEGGEEVKPETDDKPKAKGDDKKWKDKFVVVDGKQVPVGELVRKAQLADKLKDREKQSEDWLKTQKQLLADEKVRAERAAKKPKHPWDGISSENLAEKFAEAKDSGDDELADQIKNYLGMRKLRAQIKAEMDEEYKDPLKEQKVLIKFHDQMKTEFPELGEDGSEMNQGFSKYVLNNHKYAALLKEHPSGWLWAAAGVKLRLQYDKAAAESAALKQENQSLKGEVKRLSEKTGVGGTPANGRGKNTTDDWRNVSPEQRTDYFRRKFESSKS